MSEPLANALQDESENCRRKNSPLLYTDAMYNNVRDLISREDDSELRDKSYGDGSPNEICAFKLDQGKIDELANDYSAEMCVSSGHESTIQNKLSEETVKSDGPPSRNEDESRCKSSRKRKTRRKTPDGVIVDLSKDVCGVSRSGIKINVISVRNDSTPETKPFAVTKCGLSLNKQRKRLRASTRIYSSKKKGTIRVDKPVLAVFYAENFDKAKKTRKSAKVKCKSYQRAPGCVEYDTNESIRDTLHPDFHTTVNAPNLGNVLNERQQSWHTDLRNTEEHFQSFCTSDDILDLPACCHYDDTLIDVDNAQHLKWNAEQTYIDARKHIANFCCSIFNDKHQEHQILDQENYNAVVSDLNTEVQADFMAKCFHPECTRAKGCRCFCDSSWYYPDINMQHDCCSTREAARLLKNFAPPKKHQREDPERFRSDQVWANIAPEYATEADGYFPEVERGDRCANCDGEGSSTSTIPGCGTSKTSVLFGGNAAADLRDTGNADATRLEIDTCPGKRGRRINDVRPNKSDSRSVVDTWDAYARRDCIGGGCCGGRVVAVSSRSDQSPGKKGGFARGVDSEWKHGSIETDAQQLDYKWKRRIATVDANTRASVDFKGKRDSRYKSEEAIRVQLRESVKIRKRESLQMAEATSQTKSENTNVDDKRRETRDYSLWTSLQMGKIWSQVHNACKNAVKLAATGVGRVVKDASKSERSQRNPVEVAETALVESSFSCADKICGETCRKNLMRSKGEEKSKAREECTIEDAGKYRGDTEISMQKNPRAITSSRPDIRKHMCQNAEEGENEKSCVFYSEHECDRNVREFLPRNETCGHDEDEHSRYLSESFTCTKDPAYPKLRNRGGSDNNRDSIRSPEEKRKSVQRTNDVKEAISSRHRCNSITRKCTCCARNEKSRGHCPKTQDSQHPIVNYDSPITTDYGLIQTDVSRENNSHRKLRSAMVSLPRFQRKMEAYENAERVQPIAADSKAERNPMSEIASATVFLTEVDSTVRSSRNEPIASTSKWETPLVSSDVARENRPASGSSSYATAIKFWRKRPAVCNKAIAFKRRRNVGRKKLSAATCDNGMKITQIEPSTVQTSRGGNKRRTYVNDRAQTSDVIVMRILSEFLVSGERKKKVLMSITLQSKSDHDVSDRKETKETETQTPSNDVTSVGTDTFGYAYGFPGTTILTKSKTVQCFVCDKQDCYEIKHPNDLISLEETLTEEYPETSESNDYIAKRRSDHENFHESFP